MCKPHKDERAATEEPVSVRRKLQGGIPDPDDEIDAACDGVSCDYHEDADASVLAS